MRNLDKENETRRGRWSSGPAAAVSLQLSLEEVENGVVREARAVAEVEAVAAQRHDSRVERLGLLEAALGHGEEVGEWLGDVHCRKGFRVGAVAAAEWHVSVCDSKSAFGVGKKRSSGTYLQ